jgi:hypothetical protein
VIALLAACVWLFVIPLALLTACAAGMWWDERCRRRDERAGARPLARECPFDPDAELRVLMAMQSWADVPHERKSA